MRQEVNRKDRCDIAEAVCNKTPWEKIRPP